MNKIKASIKKKEFQPIYFFYGDEPLFIDELCELLEKTVVAEEHKGFDQSIFYGKDTDVDQLVSAAKRFPMISEKQFILVKEAQALGTKISGLASYFEQPSPSTVLVLAYKKKKIDKRKKIFKAVLENATVFESKRLYENQIPAWISNYLKSNGLGLGPEVSPLLVDFLGTDLGAIRKQLDKLVLNLEKGQMVTAATIEEFIGINREYNLFELQKALALGNRVKCYRIIHYFEKNPKAAPLPLMIGSLFNFFQKLYTYHHFPRKSDAELQKIMGLHSAFFVKEYRAAARIFTPKRCSTILGYLLQYDLRSKGVNDNSSPPAELMRELLFHIFNS